MRQILQVRQIQVSPHQNGRRASAVKRQLKVLRPRFLVKGIRKLRSEQSCYSTASYLPRRFSWELSCVFSECRHYATKPRASA